MLTHIVFRFSYFWKAGQRRRAGHRTGTGPNHNHGVGRLNQGLTYTRLKGTEPLRYAYSGEVYLTVSKANARRRKRDLRPDVAGSS